MAKPKKKAAKKKVAAKAAKKKSASTKKKASASSKKPAAAKKKKAAPKAKPKKKTAAAKPKPVRAPSSEKAETTSQAKSTDQSTSTPSTQQLTRSGAKVTSQKTEKKAKRKPLPFSVNDYVVYPTHGVGKITAIEDREVSGIQLEMFVVEFEKDKMLLRVPVGKVETTGMRKLASPKIIEDAMTTLKGRARIKRTMWSRRAQEYEAKINSGDPISIAEVVRDLHRNANQPEQSYSERQIYEAALDRLVREVAAVEKIDEDTAQDRLQTVLQAA
jgi:CarD family transcriptional regulator